ncbi:odorant receptor 30a-like isoform X2 [Cylas formicarius]|uniref:odorant receptor 30a-like isoform X2 n=1 Tax=Cylas formicarius TaxID=197179 RepID=UPI0029585058|nr:odorant receptor 30a-like isoform X2 [Cylas formicarius]
MADTRTERSILVFPKRFMVVTGIWRASSITSHPTMQKVYVAYCIFIKLYYTLFVTSLITEFALSVASTNSVEFTQLSYIISALTMFYATLVCDTVNFKRIISYIEDPVSPLARREDEEISKLHSRHLKIGKVVSTILVLTVASTGSAVVFENIWRNVVNIKHHSGTNDTALSIANLYYFGIFRRPKIVFAFVEDFLCVFNTILTLATKSITLTCMIFASYALQELQLGFRRIGAERNFKLNLEQVISQHRNVISYVNLLNRMVKYLILFECVFESLNVAAISVQMTKSESQSFLSLALYLSYVLIQIFLLGWTANEIKIQSVALSDALYESPWYEQSESIKKVILVMIKLAQKPLTLTVGPFDAMTMQSALAVTHLYEKFNFSTVPTGMFNSRSSRHLIRMLL